MKLIAITSLAVILLNQVSATPIAGCLLNYTITANDSCVSVAAQFQLNETDFYAMNPGLHHSAAHDCDNLDNGKPYCVCVTAPCPVSVATNVSTAVTTAATAVTFSNAPAASSTSAAASSAAQTTTVASNPAGSSAATSPKTTTATSSAPTTKIFGAIAVGLVMAATSALI